MEYDSLVVQNFPRNLRSIWDENKENIAKRIVKRDVRKTELLQFVLRMMEEVAYSRKEMEEFILLQNEF